MQPCNEVAGNGRTPAENKLYAQLACSGLSHEQELTARDSDCRCIQAGELARILESVPFLAERPGSRREVRAPRRRGAPS
ncbi:MAG: hypothetical protein ABJB47_11780 [Actinomycetota bacterium]